MEERLFDTWRDIEDKLKRLTGCNPYRLSQSGGAGGLCDSRQALLLRDIQKVVDKDREAGDRTLIALGSHLGCCGGYSYLGSHPDEQNPAIQRDLVIASRNVQEAFPAAIVCVYLADARTGELLLEPPDLLSIWNADA